MCPSTNWKTISLKKSLLNELNKIAESKDITPTTLINQILWNYIDQHHFQYRKEGVSIVDIDIPDELFKRVEAKAKRTGKSMNKVIIEAMEEGWRMLKGEA